MNSKVANYVALACIFAAGVVYLFHTNQIPYQATGKTLGPKYFPNALGVILLVLCVVAVLREWRSEAVEIAVAHKREIAATIGLTVLYILAWSTFGGFYVVTAVYFLLLVLVYSERRGDWRFVARMAGLAAAFSVLLFVFFGLLLEAKFY